MMIKLELSDCGVLAYFSVKGDKIKSTAVHKVEGADFNLCCAIVLSDFSKEEVAELAKKKLGITDWSELKAGIYNV